MLVISIIANVVMLFMIFSLKQKIKLGEVMVDKVLGVNLSLTKVIKQYYSLFGPLP